jgi:translation initiation factor IF-1
VAREDAIIIEGLVSDALGNNLFRVQLANGHAVLSHSARRDRETAGNLKPGDRVTLEMSPFDMSVGRIVFLSERKNN